MTMGAPTDLVSGVCHVVMKFPIIGAAVCLGVAGDYANVIPVDFINKAPVIEQHCVVGDDYFLIDIAAAVQTVSVGECLENIDPLTLAELRERCKLPQAKEEDICGQI